MDGSEEPGGAAARPEPARSPHAPPVPIWVTACARLKPPIKRGAPVSATLANTVIAAAQALVADMVRTDEHADIPMTRKRVARRCGIKNVGDAGWLFAYLQEIGFLEITTHHHGVGRGRDDDTLRVLNYHPPANYVGPRSHAELERALDDPDPAASVLFVALGRKSATQNADLASQSTTLVGDPADPGRQSTTLVGDSGGQSATLVGETAGQAQGGQSATFHSDLGGQSTTSVGKTAGQPQDRRSSTIPLIDRSSISDGREEIEETKPVPGRAARPPATGRHEGQASEVRRMIRKLAWQEWEQRHKQGFQLTPEQAKTIEMAINHAIVEHGITLEQARHIARNALNRATKKPDWYVGQAFTNPKNLRWHLERLGIEPLDDDPDPLGPPPEPKSEQPPAERQSQPSARPDRPTTDPADTPSGRPACDTCKAREGEGIAERQVPDPNDSRRSRRCPDCLPPLPPAASSTHDRSVQP